MISVGISIDVPERAFMGFKKRPPLNPFQRTAVAGRRTQPPGLMSRLFHHA